MAKNKTVTHIPPASSPRLASQLFSAAGELLMVAVCTVGVITIVGWIMTALDVRTGPRARRPPAELICWVDRRYGEMCRPVDRPPPVRRQYAWDEF